MSGELTFLSLGGAGEFGTNLNLYGYDGKWLMVDCGMGFGDGIRPGVEIILPNPTFIVERKSDLVGMVITHAHEDHIGAIVHIWPRLKCTIYATPFAAQLITAKFLERGISDLKHLRIVQLGETLNLGPFSVEYVRMTHSTLEPALLAIRTGAGLVIHTGDWKLDPNPVEGGNTDEARLKALGEEGVLAVIGDSTNAVVAGHSRSEAELEASLTEVFSRFQNKIAVTCFSSNVARLATIQRAAAANDRRTAIVGRSLWRIDDAARATGYLADTPPFVTDHDIDRIPRRNLVMICTGSQGEPRSALSRIAEGSHQFAKLEDGDAVVFSARAIPGNEKTVSTLQSTLSRSGVEVITPEEAFVHVSGHAAREELIKLYEWLKPQTVIPTHGEYHHMMEHAHIARELQVPNIIVPENGMIIRLAPGVPEVLDNIESGHLAVDGHRTMELDAAPLRARQKLSIEGAALCSIVLDRKGAMMTDAIVSAPGVLADDQRKELEAIADMVGDAVEDLSPKSLQNDGDVREAARMVMRRYFTTKHGKKPWIDIHVSRIE